LITSINDARAYIKELLHQRRFVKWRGMLRRLDVVKSEDEDIETIAAPRELLTMEPLVADSLRCRHVASRQGEEPFTATSRLVNAATRLRATPA